MLKTVLIIHNNNIMYIMRLLRPIKIIFPLFFKRNLYTFIIGITIIIIIHLAKQYKFLQYE